MNNFIGRHPIWSLVIVILVAILLFLIFAVWPPELVRYKLTDAAEAHRVSESRHLRGKLVFEVR